jgi:hypothetical protein
LVVAAFLPMLLLLAKPKTHVLPSASSKIPHSLKNPSLANSLTNLPPLKLLAHLVPNSAQSVALNRITSHAQNAPTNLVVHANLAANVLNVLTMHHNMPIKVMNKVAILSALNANLAVNVLVYKSIPL